MRIFRKRGLVSTDRRWKWSNPFLCHSDNFEFHSPTRGYILHAPILSVLPQSVLLHHQIRYSNLHTSALGSHCYIPSVKGVVILMSTEKNMLLIANVEEECFRCIKSVFLNEVPSIDKTKVFDICFKYNMPLGELFVFVNSQCRSSIRDLTTPDRTIGCRILKVFDVNTPFLHRDYHGVCISSCIIHNWFAW